MRGTVPDFIDGLCGRWFARILAGRAIDPVAFELADGHAGPARKEILKEWYGMDLTDVHAEGSLLGELRGRLEISGVARRIVQVRGHAHIHLHGQPPAHTAH